MPLKKNMKARKAAVPGLEAKPEVDLGAIRAEICEVLVENSMDMRKTASRFGLGRSQLAAYIGKDEVIAREVAQAREMVCDEAQARLIGLVRDEGNKNPAAAFGILKKWRPQEWGDRSRIDVHSVGFEAPPEQDEKSGPRNVLLALVGGDKDDGEAAEGEESGVSGSDGTTEGGAS